MVDQAEIHRRVMSSEVGEREGAVNLLRDNFADLPDKEQAGKDLHRLTVDEDDGVRWGAAEVLGSVFQHVADKERAWKDLHRLTGDEYRGVRRGATYSLGTVFPYVHDKEQAWKDLHRLTEDEDDDVRWFAARALGSVFQYVPDKKEAWQDLIQLTQDEDKYVRLGAADALGHAFQHVLDEEEAWNDLIQLTQDEDKYVRLGAADALGSAFPHTTDKEQVWEYLIRLTGDEDDDVRVSANHSLGRASIFKATEAESEEEFRKEVENALTFFERSSKEVSYFNPSKFCFPFYRLFHAITFEGVGVGEVQKYLADAKSAAKGSESKEALLEAVDNLANALTEAQKAGGMDFDVRKCDLSAYRQYCERAADLIVSAEDGAPGAARVLQRGLPMLPTIGWEIKEPLEEVKKRSEIVCKTACPSESELGCRIQHNAAAALTTDNPVILDLLIDHGLREFETRISSITSETVKEYVQTSVIEAKNKDTVGKILIINSLIAALLPFTEDGEKDMSKYEIKNSVVNIAEGDGISQSIHSSTNSQKDLSQNNAEAHKPSEEPKKNIIPHLSYLESEIYDRFKSVYQKEREEGISEVNSKTLKLLKSKLLDLTESGKRINWLDVGCGDGRCLEVLDAIQNRDDIRYHGIDSLHRYLDDAEERASGYGIIATFDKTNAAVTDFDSEYDVVSAVLLLHEVDPLCLPYVLRNMLKALKDDGTLVISDFQGPYEQECDVVAWNVEDITHLLEKIGVTWIKTEFIQSKQYPEELGFYRCHIKKPQLVDGGFDELLQGYGEFLTAKKKESKRERSNLRVQIEERVQELLNRSDIDLKNLSEEEMQRIRTEIEPEYGIKAYKIRLLVNQIEFLDDKIEEFNSGARCVGADQHAL